jgi:quercetin dioxygenase-like cupin family protein
MDELLETRIPLALAGAADKPWVESDPGQTWSKLLWADPDGGGWASLLKWKKGYVGAPHVHLADAHFLMLTGRIQVRDAVYGPGDYGYEPAGAVHEATSALEDSIYFFISNGRVRIEANPATGTPAYEIGAADIVAADEAARAALAVA